MMDTETTTIDHGYRGRIRRHPMGFLLAYIELPEGHPWRDLDDVAADLAARKHGAGVRVSWSGVLPGRDSWEVGFDCGSLHDERTAEDVRRQLGELSHAAWVADLYAKYAG